MNTRIAHKIITREALLLCPGYSGRQFDRALRLVVRRPRSYGDFDYAHAVLYGQPPPYADDPEPQHGARRPFVARTWTQPTVASDLRRRRSIWPDGSVRRSDVEIPF